MIEATKPVENVEQKTINKLTEHEKKIVKATGEVIDAIINNTLNIEETLYVFSCVIKISAEAISEGTKEEEDEDEKENKESEC